MSRGPIAIKRPEPPAPSITPGSAREVHEGRADIFRVSARGVVGSRWADGAARSAEATPTSTSHENARGPAELPARRTSAAGPDRRPPVCAAVSSSERNSPAKSSLTSKPRRRTRDRTLQAVTAAPTSSGAPPGAAAHRTTARPSDGLRKQLDPAGSSSTVIPLLATCGAPAATQVTTDLVATCSLAETSPPATPKTEDLNPQTLTRTSDSAARANDSSETRGTPNSGGLKPVTGRGLEIRSLAPATRSRPTGSRPLAPIPPSESAIDRPHAPLMPRTSLDRFEKVGTVARTTSAVAG